MSADHEKIVDLQSRLAHQEATLDELSAMVAEQARSIALLREQLRRLAERMAGIEQTMPGRVPDEPPPPHY